MAILHLVPRICLGFSIALFSCFWLLGQEQPPAQDDTAKQIQQLQTQVRMLTQEVLELKQALQIQQQITEKLGQSTPQKKARLYDDIISSLLEQAPENQLATFYRELIHSHVWLGGYIEAGWGHWEDLDSQEVDESDDPEKAWKFTKFGLRFRSAWNDAISIHADVYLNPDEVQISYAYLLWALHPFINVKTGVLRVPFGRYNTLYAPPSMALAHAPSTHEYLIPTIWSEPGIALFGQSANSLLSYEIMFSNGLSQGGFSAMEGNRDALQEWYQANNSDPQWSGRLGFAPRLGIDVLALYTGISGLIGQYDDHSTLQYHALGYDLFLRIGPFTAIGDHDRFEFTTEYVYFAAERNAQIKEKYPYTASAMYGYYIQFDYFFFPESWRQAVSYFTPDTTLGLSFRSEYINVHGFARASLSDQTQYTLGFHFRPIETTIFRIEYTWIHAFQDTQREWDHRILASFATFF